MLRIRLASRLSALHFRHNGLKLQSFPDLEVPTQREEIFEQQSRQMFAIPVDTLDLKACHPWLNRTPLNSVVRCRARILDHHH